MTDQELRALRDQLRDEIYLVLGDVEDVVDSALEELAEIALERLAEDADTSPGLPTDAVATTASKASADRLDRCVVNVMRSIGGGR